MKKIILFLLPIMLFGTIWGNSTKLFKSIEAVLNEPYKGWHLKVDDKNYISKAGSIERVFYKASSILSSCHDKKLQKALENTIEQLSKYDKRLLSDREIILLEKICTLLSQNEDNFWFKPVNISSIPCKLVSWTFKKEENQDPSLLRPNRNDGLFFNDEIDELSRISITEVAVFIKSIFTSSSKIDLKGLVKKDKVLPRSEKLSIQWLGHSTFLIQIENLNILTDPVTEAFHPLFGGIVRCFRRYIPPGVALKDLPKIDVIVISHNHLDHLEDKALLYLKRYQPKIFVPEGLKRYFDEKGFKNVDEYMWWDGALASSDEGKTVSLFNVPARHNSMARGGVQPQGSLWCGYVVETKGNNIYFAGDTAFNEEMFRQIKERFGPIDIALIPIAPDKMWERHIDYLDALRVINILDAKTMIPMHWGAYRTGDEKIEKPYLRMKKLQEENSNYSDRIMLLKVGQRITFSK